MHRIDIIWNVYLEDSLKSTTREIRGRGIRRRVAPLNTIPGNWQELLRLPENKTELFNFLAQQAIENLSCEKEVYSTYGQNVMCSRIHQDISSLAPCTHEEADTRMLLHAVDSANKGYQRIMLHTMDTGAALLQHTKRAKYQGAHVWGTDS